MPTTSPSNFDPRSDDDAEVLARLALGAALRRMWGGSDESPEPHIDVADADIARRAVAMLESRVVAGPERELAVRILRDVSPAS